MILNQNDTARLQAFTKARKHGIYIPSMFIVEIPGLATYFRFSFRFSRRAVVSYWRKYVHEVLVNRLGGLSLPRKSVVRLTDRPDMTLDVYRGRKTTMQQQQQFIVETGDQNIGWVGGKNRILCSHVIRANNGNTLDYQSRDC